MRNLKWKITAVAGIAVLAGGTALGVAGMAGAESGPRSSTHIDGAGPLTDDFGDHFGELGGPLCESGCDPAESDAVVLWKSILAADGYLEDASVEGEFDAETTAATREWQRDRDLDKTGKVDEATWATADEALYWEDETEGEVAYDGTGEGEVHLTRPETGGPYGYRYYTSDEGYQMWNETSGEPLELFSVTIIPARG